MTQNSKNKHKKNGKKLVLIIGLLLLLAAVIWLISLVGQWMAPTLEQNGTTQESLGTATEQQTEDKEKEAEETKSEVTGSEATGSEGTASENVDFQPIELSDGLVIHTISGYAGMYMEDGTNDPVSDVMMIILENTSSEDLQLARINIEYADFTAEFEITNLPAGEMVVALEKNKHPESDSDYLSAQAKNVVFFPEKMGLQEERILIEGSNGTLELTNISEEDIAGNIYVYYKNSAEDLLYGGITYRVSVKGGLKAGKSERIIAGHYTPDHCRILQVDCGD